MNWKKGFKRLTHILAILAGILGWLIGLVIMDNLMKPTPYWESQPDWKVYLIWYSGVMLIALICYWAVWLIYKIIKWLVLGFCDNNADSENDS